MSEEEPQDSISPEPDGSGSAATSAEAEARVRSAGPGAQRHGVQNEEVHEEPAPMIDVYPPHEAVHTWKDFFIHIATIVVGLVIAVGLEQTVEWVQHTQQRHELEAQMHQELQANLARDDFDLKLLGDNRAYLVGLNSAIAARQAGKPGTAVRLPTTPLRWLLHIPSMAVWQAAKENATVGLLPGQEIRLYDRVSFQHEQVLDAIANKEESYEGLESFEERFRDDPSEFTFGSALSALNLEGMSPAELTEYKTVVATAIKANDRLRGRLKLFDLEERNVLGGAVTEDDVIRGLNQIDTTDLGGGTSQPPAQ